MQKRSEFVHYWITNLLPVHLRRTTAQYLFLKSNMCYSLTLDAGYEL